MPSTLHPPEASPLALLDSMLQQQQTLTAVDRFAQRGQHNSQPSAERLYRDLIPAGLPGEDEQFAFEVSLDDCSGCKACVVACHNLNGLEEGELWRNVGQLVGGSTEQPVVQHVTTACHHCVEPACLHGCPVEAYEKDPITGIVRHLDDQCIGCQYCMLKCPYDVPVYSKAKGIVRKCDMCHDRLRAGEAPACVQSCPNQAIRIRVVSKETIHAESEAQQFLPGAPEPGYTLPSTLYQKERSLPRNTLPADYFSVQSSHGHLPLVVMLVLTQMSVGAFAVEQVLHHWFPMISESQAVAVRPWHLAAALLLGLLGMNAAIFHLGRPLYAYRALLGLRTSWLSREILAFSLFAAAATGYVGAACVEPLFGIAVAEQWQSILGATAALTGVAAVFCSVMIYVDTRRPLWTLGRTTSLFLLTALVLGIPIALLVSLVSAAMHVDLNIATMMDEYGQVLCRALIAVVATKLLLEASIFTHLRDRQHTPRQRTAWLLTGELSMTTVRRFFFGIVGGILLPAVLLIEPAISPGGYHPMFIVLATLLSLSLLFAGELLERYLFFAASVAPRMPGGPTA